MMNKKDCKIIQDLLPSYSDGITSQETNNYIEDHLKNCAECKNILKNMNKEIEPNETIDQAKELKYLRGFKNRRNIMVVLSIILTICLCVGVLLVRIPLNPDRFNVEWMYMENNELNIYLNTNYSNIVVTGEVESNEEKKEIVIKVKGGIPNGISGGNYGINANIDIDENTENIYIEGAFGKRKLIWSKNMNIMTKEEWERWYIEEYIPEQLEKTQSLSDALDGIGENGTFTDTEKSTVEDARDEAQQIIDIYNQKNQEIARIEAERTELVEKYNNREILEFQYKSSLSSLNEELKDAKDSLADFENEAMNGKE